jgi:hypothetical protein
MRQPFNSLFLCAVMAARLKSFQPVYDVVKIF